MTPLPRLSVVLANAFRDMTDLIENTENAHCFIAIDTVAGKGNSVPPAGRWGPEEKVGQGRDEVKNSILRGSRC